MTISRERFQQIALEVADELNEVKKSGLSFKARDDVIDAYAIEFAHALIKAVEAECDVVAEVDRKVVGYLKLVNSSSFNEVTGTKLIALPLVEGEGE